MSPATRTARESSREPQASGGEPVWDLLVAGGGTAGMVAAKTATRRALRTIARTRRWWLDRREA